MTRRLARAASLFILIGAGTSIAGEEEFERSVRPLLVAKCGGCHNPRARTGGLDLTTPEGLRDADREVGLLQAAAPGQSRLLSVIRWDEKVKMPPGQALPPSEAETLRRWIAGGAALPAPTARVGAPNADWKKRRAHWAFQPLQKTAPPALRHTNRVRNDIDRFLLARLERAGIEPPAEADRLTLLRRVKYDLLGLPPTPEEIRTFAADLRPDAYEQLVERLLASPHYGERWGRHWLDVARFAETAGIDENSAYREGWRYREYVIDAFNRDLPFNRFMIEQLAGDVAYSPDSPDYLRGRIATGFLALGPKAIVEQDKTKQLYDVIDEQIDTTSKAFLGLTVSCARCHDHKFDPVTTEDYYALASIFRSTRLYDTLEGRSSTLFFLPLAPDEAYGEFQKRQKEITAKQLQIDALIEPETTAYVYRHLHPKLADYMAATWAMEHRGAPAENAAQEKDLDPMILARLAKYLRADGSFRPFLDKWHTASAENVHAIAQEYAAMIREPAERWRSILENWAAKVAEAAAAGKQPPPQVRFEGFAFTKESERFFGDLSFLAKTLNEKDREDGAFAIPEKERKQFLRPETRERVERLERDLAGLKKSAPAKPLVTHGVAEGEEFEQHVFVRGNHSNRGKMVPKRFPEVLTGSDQPPVTTRSGRLELAQWLGSGKSPLPARVVANRLWLWHFGEGLVRTPDNFGLRGEEPTHPELLDYLAAKLIENQWSFKQMHRLILTSSAYRFSSQTDQQKWDKDPGNHLFSRFPRRRVSAEEMRDSWLAADGSLDLRTGSYLDPVAGSRTDARKGRTRMDEHLRRTLYLPVDRNSLATMMVLFDFADSTTSTSQRGETYIAPQALFLMNNPFFQQRAVTLANRLLENNELSDRERIAEGVMRAWGRPPTEEDTSAMLELLSGYPNRGLTDGARANWVALCRTLLASNNFFYID